MQNFLKILQNYLIFNAFFSKNSVKIQEKFEKSQENFNKNQEKSEKFLSLTCGNPGTTYLLDLQKTFIVLKGGVRLMSFNP